MLACNPVPIAMHAPDEDLGAYRFRNAGNGKRFHLERIDPSSKPFSSGDKAADQAHFERLALKIDEWQNLLLANRNRKLLVVLQGTDASGKDGAVRDEQGRILAVTRLNRATP